MLCNSLTDDITFVLSLTVFRRKLHTHLFRQSYPNIIMSLFVAVLAMKVRAVINLGHLIFVMLCNKSYSLTNNGVAKIAEKGLCPLLLL